MRLARRIEGRVVHVGDSRSARFWVILKTDENHEYFGYGKSFIVPTTPAIGQRFTFTPLPPRAGSKYLRAIEIMPAGRSHAKAKRGRNRSVRPFKKRTTFPGPIHFANRRHQNVVECERPKANYPAGERLG